MHSRDPSCFSVFPIIDSRLLDSTLLYTTAACPRQTFDVAVLTDTDTDTDTDTISIADTFLEIERVSVSTDTFYSKYAYRYRYSSVRCGEVKAADFPK